jgi:hypothetical protein
MIMQPEVPRVSNKGQVSSTPKDDRDMQSNGGSRKRGGAEKAASGSGRRTTEFIAKTRKGESAETIHRIVPFALSRFRDPFGKLMADS